MSFNRKITFSDPPSKFTVRSVKLPPVPKDVAESESLSSYNAGKKESSDFYLAEINKLKDDLASKQTQILEQLNDRAEQVLSVLDDSLPKLVMEIVQKILPSVELSGSDIEGNVRALIKEFSDQDEKLEVYLCPEDLKLLKALSKGASSIESSPDNEKEEEDGFASAIAGIFDNLDGDDSLLPDLPRVHFFEDTTLHSGDCQIKSRFGLLDGRISTKIRKIEEELTENG